MKKVLIIYAVLIAAIAIWWLVAEKEWSHDDDKGPKEKALAVSKHSRGFNISIENIMDAYYTTTENFVKEDESAVNQNANRLKTALGNLNLDELKKDTTGIYETAVSFSDITKGSLQQMIDDKGLEAKRRSFKEFSDNLYTLINTVHYDTGGLYWMECATAFGDGSAGYWLSNKEKSENPYGQKDCGTVKKTINVPKK
jgi:hypothetical protein